MNLFDLVAGVALIVSAVIGYVRGAVQEMVSLFAFAGAAALSVYLLPYTTLVAVKLVHPVWASSAAAAGVSFLTAYLGLRLAGAAVSRGVRGHATFGPLDRTLGLAFGLARALVVLGVVYLVFSVAPADQQPSLLTGARLYPLARGAGTALASLAPGGIRQMQGFGEGLREHMSGVEPEPPNAVEAGQDDGAPSAEAGRPRTLQLTGGAPRHRHHRPAADAPEE